MQISSIFESAMFIPNKVEQTPRSAHFSRSGRRSRSSFELFVRSPLISKSTHCDNGAMYASMPFGVKNWFMKRRSCVHCWSESQSIDWRSPENAIELTSRRQKALVDVEKPEQKQRALQTAFGHQDFLNQVGAVDEDAEMMKLPEFRHFWERRSEFVGFDEGICVEWNLI